MGENTSKELNDYFTKRGLRNYFGIPYEQVQNGLAEACVNSVTNLGRTVMAESGLGGQVWFSAAMHGVNCRNVTYKKLLGICIRTRSGRPKEEACGCPAGPGSA